MNTKQQWNGIVRNFSDCNAMVVDWTGHYVAGHPSLIALEEKMTQMLGYPAAVTNRGMTAILSVILALTKAGDVIACSEDVYPGTRAQLLELQEQGRVNVLFFDPSDANALDTMVQGQKTIISDNWAHKSGGMVRLVFTETFGNARQMRVADIRKLAAVCIANSIVLVVDTTFTPLWLPSKKAMGSGNVIIVGSMTKYHQPDDIAMGGYIVAPENRLEAIRATRFFGNSAMLPTTADYYLKVVGGILRRYRLHCDNALALAEVCVNSLAVEEVYYPGLPRHPQNDIVSRDFGGQGGGVFYLRLTVKEKAAVRLADALSSGDNGWNIAVSFGSSDWRIFPWVGEYLSQHAGCVGLVRVASGRQNAEANISAFREAIHAL